MTVYNPSGTTVSALALSCSVKLLKSTNSPGPDFAARTAAQLMGRLIVTKRTSNRPASFVH